MQRLDDPPVVDKDEEERARHTGRRLWPAATVYTVKNAADEQYHFTVAEDGWVREQLRDRLRSLLA